ncbi:hypothetical protein [Kingella potus]|uniref:hypothetical protein n=1 Tax=Kingella potus TaxID=265175 RepID=UPI001FD445DC|nr:hypothetical protein [Kingella potus]UOP01781.1 hypothetical protein LVJ84_06660 [Kingella potus]
MAKPSPTLLLPAAALALIWAQPAAACNPQDSNYHACVYHNHILPQQQQMQQQQQQQRQKPPVVDPRSLQCAPRQDGGRNCGYYWKHNGQPDYEYGENAAGQFDGVFKRYHANGTACAKYPATATANRKAKCAPSTKTASSKPPAFTKTTKNTAPTKAGTKTANRCFPQPTAKAGRALPSCNTTNRAG